MFMIKKHLCKKYNLNGFPTVSVFNNGNQIGAQGGFKNFEVLLNFIENTIKTQKKDEL